MIDEKQKKIKVIEEWEAEIFEQRLNEALTELAAFRPSVEMNMNRDAHCAYISYEKRVVIPEDIRDEFILKGKRYVCGECPYFQPSEDRRIKYTACRKGERRTYYTRDACLALYKEIERGEVSLDD